MAAVPSPVIPQVAAWLRATPGAISLAQGVVHYGPPPEALAAAARFLAEGAANLYGPVQGDPGLIQLLADKLARENGIPCAEGGGGSGGDNGGGGSRILVTAGANMGFLTAILAICDPGAEVILNVPYYFNHDMAIRMANAVPVYVATDARYHLDIEALAAAITPRTRALVTCSPNNPSGAVHPPAALAAVNALCRARGIYHIHDQAYEYFSHAGTPECSPGALAEATGHTVSLFSLSKAYGFAAYRVGYVVVPPQLFAECLKIQDTNLICPALVSQHAAMGLLRVGSGYCRERIAGIAAVRGQVLAALAGLGPVVTVPGAEGAIYCLARVDCGLTPLALAERLVREYGVGVLPGSAFGLTEGCTIRISYGSLAPETVAEGMGRLCRGLAALAAA
jgi:aspartate/methionine/tyrosine aminotransferase